MSHYCVAVFSNTGSSDAFDELLAPYSEIDESYYEFIPTEKDVNALYAEFKEKNPESTASLEEYLADSRNYIQEDGVWGYRRNPNAKWDWYTLDGKDYLYNTKEGEGLGDECFYRKSQIDFSDYDVEKDGIFWDWYVDGKPLPDGVEMREPWYKREYYLERYGTKEQYLKESASKAPYAYVTPDGVWHAPGDVGWFGVSDETAEAMNAHIDEWKAFLASAEDPYVSFVDCHI